LITSDPWGKTVDEITASPVEPILAMPNVVLPKLKVTIPLTGNPPLLVRVAVNFTDWPSADGLGEEVSFMLIFACFTTSTKTGEVLLAFQNISVVGGGQRIES
jgi:hypothetical protein